MPNEQPDVIQQIKELTKQMAYASAAADLPKMKELAGRLETLKTSRGRSAAPH